MFQKFMFTESCAQKDRACPMEEVLCGIQAVSLDVFQQRETKQRPTARMHDATSAARGTQRSSECREPDEAVTSKT